MKSHLLLPALLLLSPSLPAEETPGTMSVAARAWVASLDDAQKARAVKPFDDPNREDWHFVPRKREGLPVKEMTALQRELAQALVRSASSDAGYAKFTGILLCEEILAELEKNPERRDAGLYAFTVFGDPAGRAPWGWRAEGHHLSLNFTVVDGAPVSVTPAFWGANPAETRSGGHAGHRPLAQEEDLARKLVTSLDADQRKEALFQDAAPKDILTGNKHHVDPLLPAGIPHSGLTPPQRENLLALIHVYLDNMKPDLAEARLAMIRSAGLDRVGFAWAGGLEKGQGHYYRVQGPTFLIEYDNTQNGANHVHSVWRDFHGDFGRDLLKDHLSHDHSE
ncbi:MAG: DUF3500 domain-containing protein [Kiritimatiellia bacterium]